MLIELKKHTNENNIELVKDLYNIITRRNIKNIEELKKYEDWAYSINGKILSKKERIAYASELVLTSFYDYDDVSDEDARTIHKLKQSLKLNLSDEEKIYNLIKLFHLTGKECYFLTDAYNLIIQDKYL